jgi:enterochelin esterase-like enzyme
MHTAQMSGILVENAFISSAYLDREVILDFYLPKNISDLSSINLLLINDGQDLPKFHFQFMLDLLHKNQEIEPLLCVGIHCGLERRMEYGTATYPDYKGRGVKAGEYEKFILEELIPYIQNKYNLNDFREKAYAGFSLGGLSAIDTVWNNPHEFTKVGVFSGSLWWRLKALDEGYVEETDRIMHKQIREGEYKPGLKFYFTTGSLDEKMDRNKNGIIDSIDDTLGLIEELENKGYNINEDIVYINYEDGRHDVHTWGKAMPDFLKWGWGTGLKSGVVSPESGDMSHE